MHQLVGQSNRLHFHLSEIRKELFFFSFSSGTSIFTATAIRQNSQDPQIPEKLLEVANPFSKSQLDQSVTWISQAPAGWKVMNILSYRNEHLRTSEEKEKVTGRKTRSSLQTLWSWVWECFPGVTCNCACGPAYCGVCACVYSYVCFVPTGVGVGVGGSYGNQEDFGTWEQPPLQTLSGSVSYSDCWLHTHSSSLIVCLSSSVVC